jgi:SAM-dependent methyltransferase
MARAYVDRTPWTELRLAAVADLVDPHPGDRILDLGCAAGAVTHFVSTFGAEPVGVDSSPEAIEAATRLFPELDFRLADVTELPFEDTSFDKAVAADLAEHLADADLDRMLAETARVLLPGGTVSVYTPNSEHLIERLKSRNLILAENPTHIGLRPAGALEDAFARAGFVVEISAWRRSHLRVLRSVERLAGPRLSLFRYRLCLRGRLRGAATMDGE